MTIAAQKTDELVVVTDNLKIVHLRDQGIDVAYIGFLQSYARLSKSVLASYLGVDPTTMIITASVRRSLRATQPRSCSNYIVFLRWAKSFLEPWMSSWTGSICLLRDWKDSNRIQCCTLLRESVR